MRPIVRQSPLRPRAAAPQESPKMWADLRMELENRTPLPLNRVPQGHPQHREDGEAHSLRHISRNVPASRTPQKGVGELRHDAIKTTWSQQPKTWLHAALNSLSTFSTPHTVNISASSGWNNVWETRATLSLLPEHKTWHTAEPLISDKRMNSPEEAHYHLGRCLGRIFNDPGKC